MPPEFGNPDFPKGLLGIQLTMAITTFTWCLHNSFPKWKPSRESQWNSINQDPQLTFRKWNRMLPMHVLSIFSDLIVVWTAFSIGALWLGCQGRMHLLHQCDFADLWLMGRNCQIPHKMSFLWVRARWPSLFPNWIHKQLELLVSLPSWDPVAYGTLLDKKLSCHVPLEEKQALCYSGSKQYWGMSISPHKTATWLRIMIPLHSCSPGKMKVASTFEKVICRPKP